MIAAAVLITLFTSIASFFFGRGVAGRIGRIAEVLERTQAGDYTVRLKLGVDDELGMLSRRANLLSSTAEVREKRITESSLTDALTGLPNRALLTNRLDHTLKVASRERASFAVALIDLDRFKWVNDTLGHDAGDMLLKEVARRLKATVRTSDTVARLGGDEFVLLMEGNLDSAQAVANHVLEAMKTPMQLQGQTVDIGMSIGIAVYPDHGQDALALMRHADSAMYSAKRKQAGRSTYEGDSRGAPPAPNHLSMLGEMRAALEQKQFHLEYQPKLNLDSGLITGLEGLVRWRHPKRGRVNPAEFIPLAEQTGFMRELTSWVVAEGAHFAAELAAQEMEICVSVNVSAQDIEAPEFAESIKQILAQEELDPERLCLEITETGVISETENALNNLHAVGRMGVKLSVDDFGTGYSSLKQLQALPVNELKIDRAFVSGMSESHHNATIVNSTVEMARQLGMKVVAEGVETVSEMRALASMGCDEIQGFYLARPMAPAEVISWIQMRHSLHDSSRDEYFKMLITG
jgi:diguanylate cyclase (GGDEF)-like protein